MTRARGRWSPPTRRASPWRMSAITGTPAAAATSVISARRPPPLRRALPQVHRRQGRPRQSETPRGDQPGVALVALRPERRRDGSGHPRRRESLERRNHRRRVLEHEATPTPPPRTRAGDRTERNRETLASCRFRVVEFPCQIGIDLGLESASRIAAAENSSRTMIGAPASAPRNNRLESGRRSGSAPRPRPATGRRRSWAISAGRRWARQRPHAGMILDDTARTEHDSVDRQRHP